MKNDQTIKDVQMKILDIMKFIDNVCRENDIEYCIMGGTALGAVRHGGFIPWDDDLDIFMKPDQYAKFKRAFRKYRQDQFVIQEWKTTDRYIEYAKVRMNGTTFIEKNFIHNKTMHQGIYVDIMMLHKIPYDPFIQRLVYFESKFVVLYALSQRNWQPKNKIQKTALLALRFLPCRLMAKAAYRHIYRYDRMKDHYMYCYWLTPAKFRNGLFDRSFFDETKEIPFEDTVLKCPKKIKAYLSYRYGDYMKLPSEEQRQAAVHAYIFDINKDYTCYIG